MCFDCRAQSVALLAALPMTSTIMVDIRVRNKMPTVIVINAINFSTSLYFLPQTILAAYSAQYAILECGKEKKLRNYEHCTKIRCLLFMFDSKRLFLSLDDLKFHITLHLTSFEVVRCMIVMPMEMRHHTSKFSKASLKCFDFEIVPRI